MSHLLNSGMVGLGNKTEEETIKVWNQIGFLEGLEGKEKIKVALLYEKIAEILLNISNVYAYNSNLDVIIFPMARRIAASIKKIEHKEERAEGMLQLLTAEFIIKRASEIYPDALSFFEKHFSKTLTDIEAECTYWMSELIANEYVMSFKKKEIISLEDGKYDVVIK